MSLDDILVDATARTRMNFANTHLASAHRFALMVYEVENANAGQPFGAFIEPIMTFAVASISSAAAALEAYVNEVQFVPEEHFPNQSPALVRSSLRLVERAPILQRIAFLSLLNGRGPPDFGRKPGQNVAVLIDLRNALCISGLNGPMSNRRTQSSANV